MSIGLTVLGAKVAGAAIENGIKMLGDLPKGDSLVGYATAGSIEPTCFVDEDVRNSDLLPDTLQLAQSVFTAYYLRAFSMHNISIGNTNVASRLDKFATRRSVASGVAGMASGIISAGLEEFDNRLALPGDERRLPEDIQELEDTVKAEANVALEAQAVAPGYTVKGQQPAGKNTPKSSQGISSDDAMKAGAANAINDATGVALSKSVDVNDPVNMGIGRMVNVTIKQDKHEVNIPILVRLNAMYMASLPLVSMLANGGEDISFGARYKKWRLGGIDFWRDLVFCQDQIDAHKANLKADKTGMYLQMMQKRRQNSFAAIASGSLSANNSSNIVIMSQASAEALEMKIYGKLKDFNTRQKLFKQGYGMLMFVVDKQWGRIRMYTRDIPEYTELNERDLKASNKGGGVDISDVLAAFRAGSSPKL